MDIGSMESLCVPGEATKVADACIFGSRDSEQMK